MLLWPAGDVGLLMCPSGLVLAPLDIVRSVCLGPWRPCGRGSGQPSKRLRLVVCVCVRVAPARFRTPRCCGCACVMLSRWSAGASEFVGFGRSGGAHQVAQFVACAVVPCGRAWWLGVLCDGVHLGAMRRCRGCPSPWHHWRRPAFLAVNNDWSARKCVYVYVLARMAAVPSCFVIADRTRSQGCFLLGVHGQSQMKK